MSLSSKILISQKCPYVHWVQTGTSHRLGFFTSARRLLLSLITLIVFSCRSHRGPLRGVCIYVQIALMFRRVELIVYGW
jgi:hypothetical protein